jgi:protein-tyrosine phosphatase
MRILMVCSGNTCRSPLAEAILAAKLTGDPELGGVEVRSAGTAAWDGAPASEGAYLVALERGLDLSSHRARMLTADQVRHADLILTMSESHARRVADLGGAEKVYTLPAYAGNPDGLIEVEDPVGADVARYRAVAATLDHLLSRTLERLKAERQS